MIAVSWDSVRLFLHLLAATVWVGGQLTLAALVPALRRSGGTALGGDAPRSAARAFNRIAWPAFAVLVLTGAWNVAAEHAKLHGAYLVTLEVKLAVVLLSGVAAVVHARAGDRRLLAIFGALTGLTALLALFLGVLLAG